ncbi:MAG: hypothetical protein QOH14_1253 [Pseudonocardiales bacterium]|nr:hypothetical protein [Pseudonocardiales bacterium]
MTASVGGIVPQWSMADRLRKARELTGLDQSDFAKELGISRNTVANYERGRHEPRKIVVRAWAMRTGVAWAWLVGSDPGGNLPEAPVAQWIELPPSKR